MEKEKVSLCIPSENRKKADLAEFIWKAQDYPNLEIITAVGDSIPKNRNACLEKATGDIIIFADSDVFPFDNNTIKGLAGQLGENELLKATEIWLQKESTAFTAIRRETLANEKFDETFSNAEDIELFERLKAKGIKFKVASKVFVFHDKDYEYTIERAHSAGRYIAKIFGKDKKKLKNFIKFHEQRKKIHEKILEGIEDELKGKGK